MARYTCKKCKCDRMVDVYTGEMCREEATHGWGPRTVGIPLFFCEEHTKRADQRYWRLPVSEERVAQHRQMFAASWAAIGCLMVPS